MFNFTPTETKSQRIAAPFMEDARADFAPYYTSAAHGKRVVDAKEEVVIELAKLGGGGVQFIEGYFGDNPKRYGYLIICSYMGGTVNIQVAGLPIKKQVTEKMLIQVRVQALLNVRDWLKAAVTAQVFAPGSYPLMQYLLVDETRTLAQYVIEERRLPDNNPALPSGN